MTNREYIEKTVSGLGVTADDVDIILLKGGIEPDAQLDIKKCDRAMYKRFSVILKGAMRNISEGGYSVSWNMEAVRLFYNALCDEWGFRNEIRPAVRDRSNYW